MRPKPMGMCPNAWTVLHLDLEIQPQVHGSMVNEHVDSNPKGVDRYPLN